MFSIIRSLNHDRLRLLTETQVEGSWVERFFSDLFGYSTLCSETGSVAYHVRAKNRYTGAGRFDDFSIGWFGAAPEQIRASCELKSPGADLDKPQGGNYQNRTPVQQAHLAVSATPGVDWVIVCNFDELRLYRSQRLDSAEVFRLSQVLSDLDVMTLSACFGRTNLLGRDASSIAPLKRLLTGDFSLMVPQEAGRVRLVFEVAPSEALEQNIRFGQLDAIRRANTEVFRHWSPWAWSSDRLTTRLEIPSQVSNDLPFVALLEITLDGRLRFSTYVENRSTDTGGRDLRYIDAVRLSTCLLHAMLVIRTFSVELFSHDTKEMLVDCFAELGDLDGVHLSCDTNLDPLMDMLQPQTTGEITTSYERRRMRLFTKAKSPDKYYAFAREILVELLFPLVTPSGQRFSPTDQKFQQHLQNRVVL